MTMVKVSVMKNDLLLEFHQDDTDIGAISDHSNTLGRFTHRYLRNQVTTAIS